MNGHSSNTNGAGSNTGSSEDSEDNERPHQILLTTSSGALALITPLSEPAYRRLSAVQTFLINSLDHACGLNPRAFRAVQDAEGLASRGILDGGLLRRWNELNAQRRTELWSRLGSEKAQVLKDIRSLAGSNMMACS